MKLRSTFTVPPFEPKITLASKLFTMGSCFSTMIGEKLSQRKFNILNNPFGTVFNPVSLMDLLHHSIKCEILDPSLLLYHNQRYFHYGVHSSISDSQEAAFWEKINDAQLLTRKFLAQSSHIILTFGTAFIYELKSTGQPVCNCHKQARSLFNKRLLDLDEMMDHFQKFHALFHQVNPEGKIILTLSPVRHTREGIPENQLSKSLLRVWIHQLQQFDGVTYFPSYELMVDDLRDYRFYDEDLVHPSKLAEDYIWDIFKTTYLDSGDFEKIRMIEEVKHALQHRPFHPGSGEHQKFLQKLLEKMEHLAIEFDFSQEIESVKNQLFADY